MTLELSPIMMILLKIVVILVPVLICVAYYTLAERKVAAYIQAGLVPIELVLEGCCNPLLTH